MTQIDRYIFVLFARTIVICFFCLGGVFVVFHAFNNLDELSRQVKGDRSFAIVLAEYYGPYMLMLFDWTASIICLMSMLFTVGWLKRSGELTAILSAGISHGRMLRPMIIFSVLVMILQTVNREVLIPPFREVLTTKPGELASEDADAMLPAYDKSAGILIEGEGLRSEQGKIEKPTFRLYASYPDFGDVVEGDSALWIEASSDQPSGYRVAGVSKPEQIDRLASGRVTLTGDEGAGMRSTVVNGRPVILTSRDHDWISPGECFVVTTLNPEVLRDNPRSTRMAPLPELMRRVRNPSIHTSDGLKVMLHERILRGPMDMCLVLLGLPLVVNRGDKRLFNVVGQAMGIVLIFFALKTTAGSMGSSGSLLTPAIAAWIPLILLGPFAFIRYRDIQYV